MKFKESQTIELKKSTAELRAAMEDLCAFGNNGEGTIYFGITDKGKVVGQEVSDSTLKKVSSTILSLIEPRIYPNVYIERMDGKDVLVIEVKNGPEKPYFYKGKSFKRIGTTNAHLSRYEIEKYLYERDNPAYRFDKTIIQEYSESVSVKTLRWFLKKAKEERNLPINLSERQEDVLIKLGMVTQDQLNFAGLLAFGKNIQSYAPDAIVKCALFEGIDKTGRILDHIEIKDNIFNVIDYAENFILRNIRKSAWINPQTGRREEQYELPFLALREAVANAVAHRDYRIPSHVDVAIFDDRIEVWSPGGLPLGVKLKDLSKKHLSVLRNSTIAEVLFLAGYIERWATGVRKMNALMLSSKLEVPIYEEISSNFVVTFKRKIVSEVTVKEASQVDVPSTAQVPRKYRASTAQVKVLNFCQEPRLRNEIQEHLNLKHREHFRRAILNPLVKIGLISMTMPNKPQSSKQKYLITDQGKKLLK